MQFNNLAFSPDGKMLLLNSREGFLGLMDSFTGAIVRRREFLFVFPVEFRHTH